MHYRKVEEELHTKIKILTVVKKSILVMKKYIWMFYECFDE